MSRYLKFWSQPGPSFFLPRVECQPHFPGGLLSITTGHLSSTKPRAAARMVSVAQRSLRARGIERPQDHIAAIDSGRLFAAILVSPSPFSAEQRSRLAEYAARLGFRVLQLEGYAGPSQTASSKERT